MKRMVEKLNRKSKGEQLFVLVLMLVVLMGVFCVTGCGDSDKQSCEMPQCGSEELGEEETLMGCSIPGCGGCLSPGKGCDSACWPQSCKMVYLSANENTETNNKSAASQMWACDIRYYGDGCLGCAQKEKSCYSGCVKWKDETDNVNGFFYGSTDSKEKAAGCINGCGGCVGTDGVCKQYIDMSEQILGED